MEQVSYASPAIRVEGPKGGTDNISRRLFTRKITACFTTPSPNLAGREHVSFIVPIEFRGLQDGSLIHIAEQLLEDILQSSLSLSLPNAVSLCFAHCAGTVSM